jgi:hypothetical protein
MENLPGHDLRKYHKIFEKPIIVDVEDRESFEVPGGILRQSQKSNFPNLRRATKHVVAFRLNPLHGKGYLQAL